MPYWVVVAFPLGAFVGLSSNNIALTVISWTKTCCLVTSLNK